MKQFILTIGLAIIASVGWGQTSVGFGQTIEKKMLQTEFYNDILKDGAKDLITSNQLFVIGTTAYATGSLLYLVGIQNGKMYNGYTNVYDGRNTKRIGAIMLTLGSGCFLASKIYTMKGNYKLYIGINHITLTL